jgi:hypothetical protein
VSVRTVIHRMRAVHAPEIQRQRAEREVEPEDVVDREERTGDRIGCISAFDTTACTSPDNVRPSTKLLPICHSIPNASSSASPAFATISG